MEGRYFIIKLEIYPFDIMVSLNESDETLIERLIDNGNTKDDCAELLELNSTVRGRCVMLPSNQTIIRLNTDTDKSIIISTITHECFHATTFILERIGVKFELMVSDEAYAYLLSYIVEKIYVEMNF